MSLLTCCKCDLPVSLRPGDSKGVAASPRNIQSAYPTFAYYHYLWQPVLEFLWGVEDQV